LQNLDDLLRQIQEDERSDAVQLTPIDYGKLRGIYPQRVYKAIRNRKLTVINCLCGRRVVNVAEADVLFGFGKEEDGEGDSDD
jgi:hypothetical protein